VIHFLIATGFHIRDLFHPLRYWGYQFWSGIGSDIGEVAIIGGLITIVRHLNCHAKGCWRMGGHMVEGTPYKTCRKHHPQIPKNITAEHIAAVHADAMRDAVKVREGV